MIIIIPHLRKRICPNWRKLILVGKEQILTEMKTIRMIKVRKSPFLMVLSIKEMWMRGIKLMDLEFLNYQIGLIMKVSGFKTKPTVMENMLAQGDKCTRENGKTTGLLVRDSCCLRMGPNMRGISTKAESMAWGSIRGPIRKHITKEIGITN